MSYALIVCYSLVFTASMAFAKKFNAKAPSGTLGLLIYVMVSSAAAVLFNAVISGFQVSMNLVSLPYILSFALVAVCGTVCQLVSMRYINLILISIFSSTGGLLIPTLLGWIFLREEIRWNIAVALVLALVAILLPVRYLRSSKDSSEKSSEKSSHGKTSMGLVILLAVGLMLGEGLGSFVSKLFALEVEKCSDTSYCLFVNAFMVGIVVVILLGGLLFRRFSRITKEAVATFPYKRSLWIVLATVASNVSTLLMLLILKDIPVSLYTVLQCSMNLVFLLLTSRCIFRETITRVQVVGAVLSAAASIMCVF